MIGISGSLIWSKTLMELIFNPCIEFRWSPEGLVSEIHSPHLLVGAPGIFSDLLTSVQMLKRESGVRKAMGSYRTYSSLVKLQPRFLSLQWKTCRWAEFQPWCLRLQWRTWPWAEHWWWYLWMGGFTVLSIYKTIFCNKLPYKLWCRLIIVFSLWLNYFSFIFSTDLTFRKVFDSICLGWYCEKMHSCVYVYICIHSLPHEMSFQRNKSIYIYMIIFERKICFIAGTRTTDL